MRDFYKVLGISSKADDRRIKSAFRRRAKVFHPDLNPGDERAEQRFKELAQAYEVLRSAHARACYDALRARRRSELRWRFAQSAALMATSFLLTMGSAYAVMAWHGAGLPLGEGWHQAMSSIRVTDPTPAAGGDAKVPDTQSTVARAPAPGEQAMDESARRVWAKATSVQRHEPEAPPSAKARTTLASAAQARQRNPAGEGRRDAARVPAARPIAEAARWPWPATDGSYMGLGAMNR